MYVKEHKKKIGEASKEINCGKKNPMYGKTGKNHPTSKPVICKTTRQFFYGTKEAERITGINSSSIAKCCNGIRKSAGKLPDGTPLEWIFVEDLLKPKLTNEQKQNLKDITMNFKKLA
jgi:hypothetical protein